MLIHLLDLKDRQEIDLPKEETAAVAKEIKAAGLIAILMKVKSYQGTQGTDLGFFS